jgi:hypothetical protein
MQDYIPCTAPKRKGTLWGKGYLTGKYILLTMNHSDMLGATTRNHPSCTWPTWYFQPKEDFVKKLTHILMVSFLIGCGGGGGDGGGHPPVISNLQISPTSVMVNAGGGTVGVTGSFDFTDSGGDLTQVVLTTYDNNHTQVGSITIPVSAPGITASQAYGTVIIDTSVPGNFTFTILVYDSAGNTSNSLTGIFSVTPDPGNVGATLWPGTKITSVAYGGGLFLAGANDNSILGSADGSSWFIANSGIGKTIRRISYGNGHFVAIAEDPGNDFLIASADNGTTWTTSPQTESKDTWRTSLLETDLLRNTGVLGLSVCLLDNGATWTRVSWGLAYGGSMDAPAYGNGNSWRRSMEETHWFPATESVGLLEAVSVAMSVR